MQADALPSDKASPSALSPKERLHWDRAREAVSTRDDAAEFDALLAGLSTRGFFGLGKPKPALAVNWLDPDSGDTLLSCARANPASTARLLELGANPLQPNGAGLLPIEQICRAGFQACPETARAHIESICARGSAELRHQIFERCLDMAIESHCGSRILFALAEKLDPATPLACCPLESALRHFNEPALRALSPFLANRAKPSDGPSLLMAAAAVGSSEGCRIASRLCDPMALDSCGRGPWHHLASIPRDSETELVQALLEICPGLLNHPDAQGVLPLGALIGHWFKDPRLDRFALELLAAGARPGRAMREGRQSALYHSIARRGIDVVLAIAAFAPFDPHETDACGAGLLHMAVVSQTDSVEKIRWLLEHGCDPSREAMDLESYAKNCASSIFFEEAICASRHAPSGRPSGGRPSDWALHILPPGESGLAASILDARELDSGTGGGAQGSASARRL